MTKIPEKCAINHFPLIWWQIVDLPISETVLNRTRYRFLRAHLAFCDNDKLLPLFVRCVREGPLTSIFRW